MIQGTGPSPEEILRFQIHRSITALFRGELETLEDLAVEHDQALAKLAENLPPEYAKYVDLADHLTEARSAQLRKRVIDRGNQTIRALDEALKGFNISLK